MSGTLIIAVCTAVGMFLRLQTSIAANSAELVIDKVLTLPASLVPDHRRTHMFT